MSFLDCHPSAGGRMRYTLFFLDLVVSWEKCLVFVWFGFGGDFVYWFIYFWDRILYIPERPGTSCVAQFGLKILAELLPQPPYATMYRHGQMPVAVCLFLFFLKKEYLFPCALPAYYVCAPRVCLMPAEFRRGCRISWDWSYRWSWAAVWVQEINLVSSERPASALSC